MSCGVGMSCRTGSCVQSAPVLGVDWKKLGDGAFGQRYNFLFAVHGGELWLLGGRNQLGALLGDVWHSPDGVAWTAATANAGLPATTESVTSCMTSFGGALWFLNVTSVWSSSDGATWTAQPAPPFYGAGNEYASCASWAGKLWFTDSAGAVWSSSNGSTWTKTAVTYGTNVSGAQPAMVGLGSTLFVADRRASTPPPTARRGCRRRMPSSPSGRW